MTSASNDARIPRCAAEQTFARALHPQQQLLWPQAVDLTHIPDMTSQLTSSQPRCFSPPTFYCFSDDESRRTLQAIDANDDKMAPRLTSSSDERSLGSASSGDVVAINSPLSALSSGYSSADDENLISPNNNSQFCPFSPDDDLSTSFTATPSCGSTLLTSSGVDSKPSSSFNLDDYIDLDPIQSLLPPTPFLESDAAFVTSAFDTHCVDASHKAAPAQERSSIEQLSARGLMLNNNFEADVMDVESSAQVPASKASDASPSNITISLPPGFNAQGQDGKSVLIDVLRKADKSQLMKIHEQINAAMATLAQNKESGKASTAPELQISISAAPTSLLDATLQTPAKSLLSRSHSAPTTPMPVAAGSRRPLQTSASASDALSTSPMDFSDLTLFGDVDAQLQSFDLLPDVANHVTSFDDGLLNDVDMGAGGGSGVGVSTDKSSSISNASGFPCLNSLSKPASSDFYSHLTAPTQPSFTLAACDDVTTRCSTQSHVTNSRAGACLSSVATVVKQEVMTSDSHAMHSIDMDAAMRGLNDHSYTSRTPRKPAPERARFSATIRENRGRSAPVLEHLLTTKRPLNPMKGSDHVAQGMQQLALGDMEALNGLNQPNLLKKLLTGEMDRKAPPQKVFHSGSILTRRGSNATPPHTVATPPATFVPPAPKQEPVAPAYDDFTENVVLDSLHGMLTAEAGQELDSLWTETKESSADWSTTVKTEGDEVRVRFLLYLFSFHVSTFL